MKIAKKILFILASLVLMLASVFPTAASRGENDASYSWYVKRNKEHKQPTLDAAQAMAEKQGAYYVDRKHGDGETEKVVYLTFDAGYENGNIQKILDTLREEDVKAAFFVLKHLILKEPQLVTRMGDEGHLVCNHTANHKDMSACSKEEFVSEIQTLENVYKEHIGREIAKYYRPPEGKYSEDNLKQIQEMGYKTVFWSLAYADWDNDRQPAPEKAKKILLDNLHNGAVLLLHPTSSTNAAILGDLIRTLKSEGYRFGNLHELCGGTA